MANANPTKNLAALVSAYARLPAGHGTKLVIVGGANPRVFSGGSAPADPPGVQRTGPLGDAPLKALYQRATALDEFQERRAERKRKHEPVPDGGCKQPSH